jgi:hypothetical protein
MTYITGGLIQATDYNGFVNTTANANLNAVWATLYGQPAVSTVALGAVVTATQWTTLNNTLTAAAAHQGTSITSRSNPTVGSIISVLAAMNTDLTTVNTNQYNAATVGSQFTAWTGTSSKTTATVGSPAVFSPWTITFTHTVTFGNATQANYFFNGGGTVRIQFSKTSTGTPEDTAWNAFIATLGTVVLSATGASKVIAGVTLTGTTKVGGSGTAAVATGTGFQQLTGAPTQIFQQNDIASAYANNYVRVTAAWNGSTTLTFVTTWFDDGTGTNPLVPSQISGGTATSGIAFGTAPTTVVTTTPPETTNLTSTWGSQSINASVV